MQLPIFQVDAFTTKIFGGNPAAVCPLNEWLNDSTLQQIAEENNLSETAFIVIKQNTIELRWFTPEAEVDLCGHATLAAAHVIRTQQLSDANPLCFQTRSGELLVHHERDHYVMDFPSTLVHKCQPPKHLLQALGEGVVGAYQGFDYLVEMDTEARITALKPDFSLLSKLDLRGVIVTARGQDVDFVSRCFFPKLRVNEDPVTGSAHCQLAPFWAERLNQQRLQAEQKSQRGGRVMCEVQGARVLLAGHAVSYLQGTITLP
ncbi:PhzF family phenazine biosynthesis protein [Alteromonas flava]|uniref:PhzF family phenazine biosynthesis protein n=1 Tax=Alteromonas flava TaxID=2048003 RepID=UPI000C288C3B|nr:PhzF family phenazine biosynthesis protein [Alteromonas flava]